MTAPARIVEVEHLGARTIRIVFDDGLVREIDFARALPGVLSMIDDDDAFGRVTVDRTAGTVCWPNDIDLDPDVLHGDHDPASGPPPTVVREYRLQEAG